jgi:hypothetical protein
VKEETVLDEPLNLRGYKVLELQFTANNVILCVLEKKNKQTV